MRILFCKLNYCPYKEMVKLKYYSYKKQRRTKTNTYVFMFIVILEYSFYEIKMQLFIRSN